MKNKLTRTLCAAVAAVSAVSLSFSVSADTWEQTRGNDENNGVVAVSIPQSKEDAALYWAQKVGTSWSDAPSPITMADDWIIFTSADKLCKMDKTTGEISETTGQMAGTQSYAVTAPLYADGMIFVGFDGGSVQAFDADTLESLWIYSDPLGGQSVSPIYYSDGYIYTGFWSQGWSETDQQNFVCIDVTDEDPSVPDEEKSSVWTYTSAGGFYWAGAYANDDFVVVGTEDGNNGADSYTAKIITFNKSTGEILDSIDDIHGDVRSSIVFDSETDRYYFTTKGGEFYSVKIDSDGTLSDLKSVYLGAASTSTPVIAGGRAYVGTAGQGWGSYNGSAITVIDLDSFAIAYKAPTLGYPQVSGICSTDEDGYNYVYFVENTDPSEIRYVKDKKGVTEILEPSVENGINCAPVLFTPVGEQSNYAIASLIADSEGTLYFKNDSSYIMAVGAAVEEIVIDDAETVYKAGDSFDLSSVKATAVLSNGLTRTVPSDKLTVTDAALTEDDIFVTVSYDYALYNDGADGAGTDVKPVTADIDIIVLGEEDYNAVKNTEALIEAIGEVTLDSADAVSEARNAYDALSEELKAAVSNYDVLEQAEADYAKLLENAEQEQTPEKDPDENGNNDAGENSDENAGSISDNGGDTDVEAEGSETNAPEGQNNDAEENNEVSDASTANPATGAAGGTLAGLAVIAAAAVLKKRK